MKLKVKLALLILGILLLSFGLCGFFSISRLQSHSLSILVESEQEKLDVTARAFRQAGTREDFEQMGEKARDAYLKYQFERCYESGFALLKSGDCLVNLTDYDIINPAGLTGEYQVQKLKLSGANSPEDKGKTVYLLLMRHALAYPPEFEVMTVKNITSEWKLLREQAAFLTIVFVTVSLMAAVVTLFSVRYLLSGLDELRRAAGSISAGRLGVKVPVSSGDEIGQVEEAFNRMSEQVEQKVEDLQLLLGALAHEMKTPLTSIMGYADSLLHVRLPAAQQEKALRHIYDSGLRMEKMSSKLLSLIGMYENQTIECSDIRLSDLFQAVREETKEILREKEIRLLLSCSGDAAIKGDEILLKSLVSNLVLNSCKASGKGGTILLNGWEHTIEVRDHGRGIPERDLPFVTNPFYMADKSRSRSEGGSGLGLALGKRIAELHRASLTIWSREGEGTAVRIVFPSAGER